MMSTFLIGSLALPNLSVSNREILANKEMQRKKDTPKRSKTINITLTKFQLVQMVLYCVIADKVEDMKLIIIHA